MKRIRIPAILGLLFALMVCPLTLKSQTPIGTAFTYRGYLTKDTTKVKGKHDFLFTLFDANTAGNQVGSIDDKNNIDVNEGHFDVLLDFGNVYDGNALWLETEVRETGDIDYILLSPRLRLTLTPISLYTPGVVPIGGIIMWSGATDNIPDGWLLCDGNNRTPNLTDRFVIGAGSAYEPNQVGGDAAHRHEEYQIPRHTHKQNGLQLPPGEGGYKNGYEIHAANSSNSPLYERWNDNDPAWRVHTGVQENEPQSITGASEPTEALPPYFALAYIMRVL